jgi:hypothetical protein
MNLGIICLDKLVSGCDSLDLQPSITFESKTRAKDVGGDESHCVNSSAMHLMCVSRCSLLHSSYYFSSFFRIVFPFKPVLNEVSG